MDNGFIVIHGKRPGSPAASCRRTVHKIHSPFAFRCASSIQPWGHQARGGASSGAPSLTFNPNGCWGLEARIFTRMGMSEKLVERFVGIDISKATLDVCIEPGG